MLYALSWFFVLAALALWSFATWAIHAIAVWTVSNAGELSGAASAAGSVALPDGLAQWIPPELAHWASQAMGGMAPLIDSLLQAAPALAGGLTVAAWVIWGLGAALLLLLGAALHLLIAVLRSRVAQAAGPKSRLSLAAR